MNIFFRILGSRPLLVVLFFVVVMPAGLLMRLAGRDPMRRSPDPSARSYRVASPVGLRMEED